jgi:hypothetical protein
MSSELVVVAGLRDNEPDACVTPEHFLCTAFPARIDFPVHSSEAELIGIATGILSRLDPRRTLHPDVGVLLSDIVQGEDHLHAITRLLRLSIELAPGIGPIDATLLRAARNQDIESHLGRIEYRGRTCTLQEFLRWQSQFPAALHPITVDIVRLIGERYYLSTRHYWESIDRLIAESGLTSAGRVVFCQWQPLGKSNPAVMHHVKNHQKLKVMQHLDLTGPPKDWPQLTPKPPPNFVIVDDFIGTGGTICTLLENEPRVLIRLLNQYSGSRAIVIAIAALDKGARRVDESLLRNTGGHARLYVGTRFDDADRCFSEASRAITTKANRDLMRQFCEDTGKRHFPPKFWFGFEESESLVVFPDAVPNNSLPILWYDESDWFPLFPASGRRAVTSQGSI